LWQIDIGAYDTARISSDQIVGSEGDWGYGVWISFGSNAASGTLDIPPSVVVDGYVVWNGLSGVFNPGTASFTLPLRFTSMP
jgi:hypothetical protein